MKKEELLEEIKRVIKDSENRTTLMMRQLTEEILVARGEIKELKKLIAAQMIRSKILIPEPFASVEEFENFEVNLRNNLEDIDILEKEFYLSSDKSSKDFIRRNWRKVFNDCVAEKFSWTGTSNKTALRTTITSNAIKNAYRSRFKDSSDYEYEQISMKHIQTAADRIKKLNNYYKKSKIFQPKMELFQMSVKEKQIHETKKQEVKEIRNQSISRKLISKLSQIIPNS